jgi:glycine cleavage system regulatory protein
VFMQKRDYKYSDKVSEFLAKVATKKNSMDSSVIMTQSHNSKQLNSEQIRVKIELEERKTLINKILRLFFCC